jgi:hypothetical protein
MTAEKSAPLLLLLPVLAATPEAEEAEGAEEEAEAEEDATLEEPRALSTEEGGCGFTWDEDGAYCDRKKKRNPAMKCADAGDERCMRV